MAIAFVDSVADSIFSGSGTTVSSPQISVSAGNLVVVAGYCNTSSDPGVCTLTDSVANDYTERAEVHNTCHLTLGYSFTTTGSSTLVATATWANAVSGQFEIHVLVFSKTGGSWSADTGNSGTGYGTSVATGTFTTTGTDEVAVAVEGNIPGSLTETSMAIGSAASDAEDLQYSHSWYKIFTTTQTNITASCTLSANENWMIDCVAIKAIGSSSFTSWVTHYRRMEN